MPDAVHEHTHSPILSKANAEDTGTFRIFEAANGERSVALSIAREFCVDGRKFSCYRRCHDLKGLIDAASWKPATTLMLTNAKGRIRDPSFCLPGF
jgi:hypothetical protein